MPDDPTPAPAPDPQPDQPVPQPDPSAPQPDPTTPEPGQPAPQPDPQPGTPAPTTPGQPSKVQYAYEPHDCGCSEECTAREGRYFDAPPKRTRGNCTAAIITIDQTKQKGWCIEDMMEVGDPQRTPNGHPWWPRDGAELDVVERDADGNILVTRGMYQVEVKCRDGTVLTIEIPILWQYAEWMKPGQVDGKNFLDRGREFRQRTQREAGDIAGEYCPPCPQS